MTATDRQASTMYCKRLGMHHLIMARPGFQLFELLLIFIKGCLTGWARTYRMWAEFEACGVPDVVAQQCGIALVLGALRSALKGFRRRLWLKAKSNGGTIKRGLASLPRTAGRMSLSTTRRSWGKASRRCTKVKKSSSRLCRGKKVQKLRTCNARILSKRRFRRFHTPSPTFACRGLASV